MNVKTFVLIGLVSSTGIAVAEDYPGQWVDHNRYARRYEQHLMSTLKSIKPDSDYDRILRNEAIDTVRSMRRARIHRQGSTIDDTRVIDRYEQTRIETRKLYERTIQESGVYHGH